MPVSSDVASTDTAGKLHFVQIEQFDLGTVFTRAADSVVKHGCRITIKTWTAVKCQDFHIAFLFLYG